MRIMYLRVWGQLACFSMPELNVERLSYPVMTPSAARGILQAIYWKPEMEWQINEIHILNPVQRISIKRNEVSRIASDVVPYIDVTKCREQRSSSVLKDVDYVIAASITAFDDNYAKHIAVFTRRAMSGQCYYNPYLGCREFIAYFELIEKPPKSKITGKYSIGCIFYDYDYRNECKPYVFNAKMEDGVITVPLKEEVFDR